MSATDTHTDKKRRISTEEASSKEASSMPPTGKENSKAVPPPPLSAPPAKSAKHKRPKIASKRPKRTIHGVEVIDLCLDVNYAQMAFALDVGGGSITIAMPVKLANWILRIGRFRLDVQQFYPTDGESEEESEEESGDDESDEDEEKKEDEKENTSMVDGEAKKSPKKKPKMMLVDKRTAACILTGFDGIYGFEPVDCDKPWIKDVEREYGMKFSQYLQGNTFQSDRKSYDVKVTIMDVEC